VGKDAGVPNLPGRVFALLGVELRFTQNSGARFGSRAASGSGCATTEFAPLVFGSRASLDGLASLTRVSEAMADTRFRHTELWSDYARGCRRPPSS
jgi:hypothetical protein